MTRARMRLAALVALAACGAPPAGDALARRGSATFAVAARSAVPGPFVSVADSLALRVTASDGAVSTFGVRLPRRDTSVTFPLELPDGPAVFRAEVVSRTAKSSSNVTVVPVRVPAVLYDREQTVNIDRDDFDVRLVVAARVPVLLTAPDTLRLVLPFPSSTAGQGQLTVHNRGLDSLRFGIADTTRNSVSQCGGEPCFDVAYVSGAVAAVPAGGSVVLRIRNLRVYTTPITLWFVSAQGDVPVVVRPP